MVVIDDDLHVGKLVSRAYQGNEAEIHLFKVGTECPLEQLRVPLEKGQEKAVQVRDRVAVSLREERVSRALP